MKQTRVPECEVMESASYENFVAETEKLPFHELQRPKDASSDYPKTIKVHIQDRKNCDKFATLINQPLCSDDTSITFDCDGLKPPRDCRYTENRKDPNATRTSHLKRIETDLWIGMIDFEQNQLPPYITFDVTCDSMEQYAAFARVLKQEKLSLNTKYIWYPRIEEKKTSCVWKSSWRDHNPRYPIYIVSKKRADSRLTSRILERMGVPYFIVIEPPDYDHYSYLIDEEKILVLPFKNHGDGPGRARNWCWDHSISIGAKKHWVLDDNIDGFFRLHQNKRIKVADGGVFRLAEDFVDRFENVPVSGFQYRFFCAPREAYPPFVLNTRIYSCLLIDNSCKHRWRGRYNEDTDLSLRVLKDGDCTIQFNAFLQGKVATQTLKGGNTDEFYHKEFLDDPDELEDKRYHEKGTINKSRMLEAMHPDVAKVVWRYGRWHHYVDYGPFKDNKPIFKSNDFRREHYKMELVEI